MFERQRWRAVFFVLTNTTLSQLSLIRLAASFCHKRDQRGGLTDRADRQMHWECTKSWKLIRGVIEGTSLRPCFCKKKTAECLSRVISYLKKMKFWDMCFYFRDYKNQIIKVNKTWLGQRIKAELLSEKPPSPPLNARVFDTWEIRCCGRADEKTSPQGKRNVASAPFISASENDVTRGSHATRLQTLKEVINQSRLFLLTINSTLTFHSVFMIRKAWVIYVDGVSHHSCVPSW